MKRQYAEQYIARDGRPHEYGPLQSVASNGEVSILYTPYAITYSAYRYIASRMLTKAEIGYREDFRVQ